MTREQIGKIAEATVTKLQEHGVVECDIPDGGLVWNTTTAEEIIADAIQEAWIEGAGDDFEHLWRDYALADPETLDANAILAAWKVLADLDGWTWERTNGKLSAYHPYPTELHVPDTGDFTADLTALLAKIVKAKKGAPS